MVATAKAFNMIDNFFELKLEGQKIEMGNGGTLSLGYHQLTFVFAPMVHWPEVMVTYDSTEKVLFSADGFGKFGALDVDEPWDDEARRYFIGIVGKYGVQVQNLLKVAATLDIQTICPLHGPVLNENLGHYIGLYDTWSSYTRRKTASSSPTLLCTAIRKQLFLCSLMSFAARAARRSWSTIWPETTCPRPSATLSATPS